MKTVNALRGTSNDLKDHYFYLLNNFLMAVPIFSNGKEDSLNDDMLEEWALETLSQESLIELFKIYRELISIDYPCDELTKVYVKGLRTKKIEVYA